MAEEEVGANTPEVLTARGPPGSRRRGEERGSDGVCPIRRGAATPLFLLSILLPLLLLSGNALGQQPQRQNKQPAVAKKAARPGRAKTVTDLFNTSSCADPPYRCPYPRIEFYLYTRSTQEEPEKLDLLKDAGPSLMETHFDAAHPTKIVIHGFGGGRKLSPSPDMRKAYFTRGEYNVIIVDYSSLVVEPCLSQVEWGPRFCALCIAQLIGWLDDVVGSPPQGVHVIGYSVGAHIAGLLANYVGARKIGRITGLDPTIIFYMGNNRSRDLDPTDALFVDVIHTGAGVLGQWGPNGHVDFYVNGGTSQPGCTGGIYETLACDHQKVTPYFIESITSEKGFWATPCTNLLLYLIGWCTTTDESKLIKMGEDVPISARGIYYLETNARRPYAKGRPSDNTRRKRRGRG
ncbi:pancreatic triacylglycerol lipase-like [Hetaerina americana]|uniref:pancreatic triacylglycerol lipase-like n=1 Tax=Hetaerina americana TaxID=62018 RepID=UPI003A7F2082